MVRARVTLPGALIASISVACLAASASDHSSHARHCCVHDGFRDSKGAALLDSFIVQIMAPNFDDVCSQLQRLHDIARVEVILCNLAVWRSVLHIVKHLGLDVHDLARQLVDLKRHYPLLGQSVELRLVEGFALQGVLVSITGLSAQQLQNCIVVVLVDGG